MDKSSRSKANKMPPRKQTSSAIAKQAGGEKGAGSAGDGGKTAAPSRLRCSPRLAEVKKTDTKKTDTKKTDTQAKRVKKDIAKPAAKGGVASASTKKTKKGQTKSEPGAAQRKTNKPRVKQTARMTFGGISTVEDFIEYWEDKGLTPPLSAQVEWMQKHGHTKKEIEAWKAAHKAKKGRRG